MRRSEENPRPQDSQIINYLEAMSIDQKISIIRNRIGKRISDPFEPIDRDDFDMMTNVLDVIVSIEHVRFLSGKC